MTRRGARLGVLGLMGHRARRAASPFLRGRASGVTLIELMVVLAIMVSIMAIGFIAVGVFSRAALRDETLKLSGAVTHVYHQAAIRNLVYRLVIDMDSHEYWSEVAEGNVVIPNPEEQVWGDPFESFGDEEDEGMFDLYRPGTFEPADDSLLSRRKLENNIRFAGVMTEHHEEMVVEGQATITFFPSGYAERAVIYLTDGKGYYTLTIDPLTGKTRTYSERRDIDSDFFEVEEDE